MQIEGALGKVRLEVETRCDKWGAEYAEVRCHEDWLHKVDYWGGSSACGLLQRAERAVCSAVNGKGVDMINSR